MTSYAFGHFLQLSPASARQNQLGEYMAPIYKFQNFFINREVTYDGNEYLFLPFGFSGVTINRTGDGTEANLIFPNNAQSKLWADEAIKNRWLAQVDVVFTEPDAAEQTSGNPVVSTSDRIHRYTSQITGGSWNEVSLQVSLSTILDAVGGNVPRRTLTQRLVGRIPTSSNVRLQ